MCSDHAISPNSPRVPTLGINAESRRPASIARATHAQCLGIRRGTTFMARPIKRSSLFCGPVNNQKRCGTRKTPRQVGRLSSAKRKFREQLPPPRRCFEPCAEGTAVQSRLGKGHAPVRWKLACTDSVVTLSWRAKFALHRIERSRSSRAGAAIAGANWSSEPKNLGIFWAGRFRSFRRKRIVPRSRLEVPVAGANRRLKTREFPRI